MKIKKILNKILLSVSLFTILGVCIADICDDAGWQDCLSSCGDDPVCMNECQEEYNNNCDGNNQTQNSTISCDYYPNEYGDCDIYIGNYEYSDGCCVPADFCLNLPENGVCPEGFSDVAGCCQPVCGGNTYLPEGSASMNDCIACGSGTVPNANHTKCICNPNEKCCGIQLNTVVPFIGDCIELDTDSSRGDTTSVNSVTAFPILMQGLMKIVMSVIMVFSFLMVIVSGLMMTAGAFKSSSFDKGKSILKNVIISLILLGSSGLILSLINPSFFGG